MSRQILIGTGHRGVSLPNGLIGKPGDVVILTDAQWAQISGSPLIGNQIIDQGVTTTVPTKGTDKVDYPTLSASMIPLLSGAYAGLVTKRATYTFGSSNSTFGYSGGTVQYSQRTIVTLPVLTTRWRLKIANKNAQTGAVPTSTAAGTLNGVYIGTPVYGANGRYSGPTTAAPLAVLTPSATIPSDGSDLVTAWITSPASQFTAHQQFSLGLDLSVGATSAGVIQSDIMAFTGVSTPINIASPALSAGAWLYDVRIEYEAVVATKAAVGFVIGASGESGYNPDLAPFPIESWPHLVGLTNNSLVINGGLGGSTSASWTSGSGRPYNRFDLATTVPDYAIIGMLASNDIAALSGGDAASSATVATALAATQANYASIVANIRALGTNRIYFTTIPPRNFKMTQLAAAAAINATTISTSASIPVGSVITIGSGPYADVRTTTAVSGAGPYTVTVPALTYGHPQTEVVTGGFQALLAAINKWIRTVPLGIEGVIDFDLQLGDKTNRTVIDARFVGSDNIHPLQGGHQVMAMSPAITSSGF